MNNTKQFHHLNTKNKLKLKEFILEKQVPFTVSSLLTEIEMDRRSLARFLLILIDEGYVEKTAKWEYQVVKPDTSWKTQYNINENLS